MSDGQYINLFKKTFEQHIGKWPFTVDKVKVAQDGVSLIVIVNSTAYALNGVAQKHYRKINEIWKDNPDIPGTKVSLTDIIKFSEEKLKV